MPRSHLGQTGPVGLKVRARAMPAAPTRFERGSSLVEVALLFAILVPPLLFGVIDFGRAFYFSIEVTNAARAGAQYGAQNSTTAQDTTGIISAATSEAADVARLTLMPAPTYFCQCVGSSGPPGTTTSCTSPSCTGGNHVVGYLQVNTQTAYTPLFPYPGVPSPITLKGLAIMQVSQ
jgi:Flp pilus assembly protein TadG